MEVYWIVVADAARARIFHWTERDPVLEEIHTLVHPQSEEHPGDLRTGGKGEVNESTAASSHQSDAHTTTMEKQADDFATELTDFLNKARIKNDYTGLVLVAEPRFLGRVRTNLDNSTAQMVKKEIDKDWSRHETHQIEKFLYDRRDELKKVDFRMGLPP